MEEWQKDLLDIANTHNLHRIANKVTEGGAKQEAKKKRSKWVPDCPHCGGPLARDQISCCQNCGRDVSWVGRIACQPGHEAEVRAEASRRAAQQRLNELSYRAGSAERIQEEKRQKIKQIRYGLQWSLFLIFFGVIELSVSYMVWDGSLVNIAYLAINNLPVEKSVEPEYVLVGLAAVIFDFVNLGLVIGGLCHFSRFLYLWLSSLSENVAAPQSQALPNVNRSSQISANATFSETKAPLKKDKPIPIRQHQAKCPQCMTLIGLNDSHFGKVVACPKCKKAIKFVRKS
jgi:ssDNA-binding Zn-finger/Zn-ribbon topoisomerase 1